MDNARKCYQEYIESKEYEANDGWHTQMWEIAEIPAKFMAREVYSKFDEAIATAVCEIEARSFIAGFNAAMRCAVAQLMESTQCSMT